MQHRELFIINLCVIIKLQSLKKVANDDLQLCLQKQRHNTSRSICIDQHAVHTL